MSTLPETTDSDRDVIQQGMTSFETPDLDPSVLDIAGNAGPTRDGTDAASSSQMKAKRGRPPKAAAGKKKAPVAAAVAMPLDAGDANDDFEPPPAKRGRAANAAAAQRYM